MPDFEIFARNFVQQFDWRDCGTWLMTRIRTLERGEQALRREAYEVMMGTGPATLADAQRTAEAMRGQLAELSEHLAAIVEMRNRLR